MNQFPVRSSDTDTVTLTPDLVITSQSIGVASSSTDVQGVDGILWVSLNYLFSSAFELTSTPRIGLVHLAEGTVNGSSNRNRRPLVTMHYLHRVYRYLLQLVRITFINSGLFPPMLTSILESITNGELTFGGTWVSHRILFILYSNILLVVICRNSPEKLPMLLSQVLVPPAATGVSVSLSVMVQLLS